MTEHSALVPLDESAALESVQVLCNIVRAIREKVFVEGTDFGVIPGTGNKPVLLLPGMEKLMRALRLRAEYRLLSVKEDFETPIFYFRYECRLVEIDTGLIISTAIGSANSMETKWRWRDAKRVCPGCGKETINRSKIDNGWYCWVKIGGCGLQFAPDDTRITGQRVGRVENPDIFDQLNTIDKIAQKRALASAIKVAANVSEFFTVDLEDLPQGRGMARSPDVVEGEYVEVGNGATPRDFERIYAATQQHFETREAFDALIARLTEEGRINPRLGDTQVIALVRQERLHDAGRARAWWQNAVDVRRVKGQLMVRYHLSLEAALRELGRTLPDFETPDDLLSAVATHLTAREAAER